MKMSSEGDKHFGRFYGVYLLCSQSTEKYYKGKCYIGFTVNPNRRINQHNRGIDFGGARKTNNKGPWKMVMIVHGFPNNIAALQFEWAWQQPMQSSRLKNFSELKRKQPKESHFQYNFRILSRMLNVGPWQRLPLIIRWIEPEYKLDFEFDWMPPKHMQIVSGPITIAKESKKEKIKEPTAAEEQRLWSLKCHLCLEEIDNPQRSRIGCVNATCKLTSHLICLANHMIASDIHNRGHYIPISGECPVCETEILWAELISRKQKQQQKEVTNLNNDEDDDDESEEEELVELKEIEIASDEEMRDTAADVEKLESSSSMQQLEIYELSD